MCLKLTRGLFPLLNKHLFTPSNSFLVENLAGGAFDVISAGALFVNISKTEIFDWSKCHFLKLGERITEM
jgi:hypothetical protein